MTDTAVAIFVFNRPRETDELLQRLRNLRVKQLLVVGDGPRAGYSQDMAQCNAVRALIESVDWVDSIAVNFSQTNLGLEERFISGLEWVFSRVEEAVILEDDCLPGGDFLSFAEFFLNTYRDREDVGMIQGWTPLGEPVVPEGFFLSSRPKVWGWATWARVAKGFDGRTPLLDSQGVTRHLRRLGYSRSRALDFARKLSSASEIGTWDYQWVWHLLSRNMKSVSPTRNLVQNVGFGDAATHTKHSLGFFDKSASSISRKLFSRNLGNLSFVLDRLEDWFVRLGIIRSLLKEPGQIPKLLTDLAKRANGK